MGCNCNGCPVRDVAAVVMVIVEVPEGVMMGGGPVVTMLLLLPLLLPQPVAWRNQIGLSFCRRESSPPGEALRAMRGNLRVPSHKCDVKRLHRLPRLLISVRAQLSEASRTFAACLSPAAAERRRLPDERPAARLAV